MQNPQPSKQFRWVGQPSEEELLGIRVSAIRHPELETGPVRRFSEPPERPVPLAPSPEKRVRARDALTVLAVGAVVWLVLGGAGAGFRYPGSAPAAGTETLDAAPARVVLDRGELASLPRGVPSNDRGAGGGGEHGDRAEEHGSSSREKGNHEPPPGNGGGGGGEDPAEPPLLRATVPIVGTVTLDEPELPSETLPSTSELTETEGLLPETPTLP